MVLPSSPAYTLKGRRILLLGDSLTQRGFERNGWASTLANSFIRKADVVNRGLSGYNTRGALKALDHLQIEDSDAFDTILAVVWYGANDAARPDGPEYSRRQHVPVPEFKANLSELVERVKGYGARRVLLVTPPPVYDKGRKAHQFAVMGDQAASMPLDRNDDFTAHYAAAAAEVAALAEVPLLDLYKELRPTAASEGSDLTPDAWAPRLLCDGLHFSEIGQGEVAALVAVAIQEHFADISPEALSPVLPFWDQLAALTTE